MLLVRIPSARNLAPESPRLLPAGDEPTHIAAGFERATRQLGGSALGCACQWGCREDVLQGG